MELEFCFVLVSDICNQHTDAVRVGVNLVCVQVCVFVTQQRLVLYASNVADQIYNVLSFYLSFFLPYQSYT